MSPLPGVEGLQDDDEGKENKGTPGHENQRQDGVLACPFYKHDSIRHRSCFRLRLSRIRDVKQHLIRRHCRPRHPCPVCDGMPGSPGCHHIHPPPGGIDVEGVSWEQQRALSRRVDRALDVPSQWYSVWDIVFPGVTRPASPYRSAGTRFGEVLNILHDYWEGQRQILI
ncbi:hypothetical protein C8A05DRAFT_18626, partial [Staphylotrichum tortipilum]